MIKTSWLPCFEGCRSRLNTLAKWRCTKTIYPPPDRTFRCLTFFELRDTKVVILGQDPYHDGSANGLAFASTGYTPPSLRNVLAKAEEETGYLPEPDLEAWARQGVLLLNSALTVVKGKPGSHVEFWRPYVSRIIRTIDRECDHVAFVAWGARALELLEGIDKKKHRLLACSHPSPYSWERPLREYPSFRAAKVFRATNDFLESVRKHPIRWS